MTEKAVRVPETARRLGMPGTDVYDLILRGELEAGKGEDGMVWVPLDALENYRERHATTGS